MDGNDARVVESCSCLRLDPKTSSLFSACQHTAADQFQCDRPLQPLLPRPIDDPHASACDFRFDHIGTDLGADQRMVLRRGLAEPVMVAKEGPQVCLVLRVGFQERLGIWLSAGLDSLKIVGHDRFERGGGLMIDGGRQQF